MIARLRVPGSREHSAAAGSGKRGRSRRGGFTFVEALVAVSIVGILAGLALPNMKDVLLRAQATKLAGDMEVVRVAAASYNAKYHAWPAETAAGKVPPELVPYLPANYSFVRDGYELDYENWSLPGGLPGDPKTHTLIGVSVVVTNPALGNALVELLGKAIIFSVGNRHTIVIDRS
ncbi:MAG: prepilin-type N-terminal cleavage/methylation domain-containing protein [Gemmatimonadetes bacterium]|nr:prepilin-type N-terminal cleavage/methylation domain-containing protein [Gemmatimonadota bacterium]